MNPRLLQPSGLHRPRRLSGDLLRHLGLNYPGNGRDPLDEKGLGLDREDHPSRTTRVARPGQAQSLLDALGPYRDPEAGRPAADLSDILTMCPPSGSPRRRSHETSSPAFLSDQPLVPMMLRSTYAAHRPDGTFSLSLLSSPGRHAPHCRVPIRNRVDGSRPVRVRRSH